MHKPEPGLQVDDEPQSVFCLHADVQFFPLPVGETRPGIHEHEYAGGDANIPVQTVLIPHVFWQSSTKYKQLNFIDKNNNTNIHNIQLR